MKTLTCRELIDFLDDYVAGKQPSELRASFEEHLKVCTACRGYLTTYRDTIRLSQLAMAEPNAAAPASVPSDLVKAILHARNTTKP